jgi:long-chain fatty acid transport protein
MTPYRTIFVLFVAVVVTAAMAFAGGFQLNEHGARAMAQGGAFAARAYDGSAVFFNPAGLAFQMQPSIYAGVTIIAPTGSFYGPLQNNSNEKTDNVQKIFTPINVYFSYPLTDSWHVAIGVNNPFGLGNEWPLDWPGKYISTKVELQTFFFTPTVAYKVNDKFSLAAGFSYVTGTVIIERAVAAGFDDPRVNLDLKASGVGYSAGAMYKFTPKFSVGLSYRSQVKVDATGTATFTPAYSVLPAGDASTSITLPATAFLGVACKVMDNLEIEGDVQFTGWSSYNELAIEFKKTGQKSATPKNYKDTYLLRFGGEYTIDALQLRAGYLHDFTPVKTSYVDPTLPDADRNGISVGVGYDITKNFSVDLAYLYLPFNDRKAVNTIPELSFDGTYKTRVNLFAVDFGYTF